MSRNTRSGSCLSTAARASRPSRGLPDDLDIAQLVELVAQLFSRQLFVVYDENSHAAPDVRPLHRSLEGSAHSCRDLLHGGQFGNLDARTCPAPGSLVS